MDDIAFADKICDLGGALINELKLDSAKAVLKQANILKPNDPKILSNLGAVHWTAQEMDEALRWFALAIEAGPTYPQAYGNRGLVHQSMDHWDLAFADYNKCLELDPNSTNCRWDRMITHLDMGNWKQGFDEYDVRFEIKNAEYHAVPFPQWNGEDLSGKTLYVQTEQGFGDRIMFQRFIPFIKDKYPTCKILLLTEQPSIALFWHFKMMGIIDEIVPFGVTYPHADYAVWLLSLPGIFGLTPDTIPPDPGHLSTYANYFKKFLKMNTIRPNSLKVGICWSGNPKFQLNHWRSIPFNKILGLIDDPSITWFSLQCGPPAKDLRDAKMQYIIQDIEDQMLKDGWNATFMILANLDLLITVDTGVAHLAGALGVPVWNIINRSSYWPFGRGHITTTPWYPSMTLMRQTVQGDWDGVLSQVKEKLLEFKSKNVIV